MLMTGNFDDELKKLESELGDKLSELREVTPEPGFQIMKDLAVVMITMQAPINKVKL